MVTVAKIYSWYQPLFEAKLEWTRGTAQAVITVYADYDEDFDAEYIVAIKYNDGPAEQVYKGYDLEAAKQATEARREMHVRQITTCATGLSGVQVQEIVPATVTFDWE